MPNEEGIWHTVINTTVTSMRSWKYEVHEEWRYKGHIPNKINHCYRNRKWKFNPFLNPSYDKNRESKISNQYGHFLFWTWSSDFQNLASKNDEYFFRLDGSSGPMCGGNLRWTWQWYSDIQQCFEPVHILDARTLQRKEFSNIFIGELLTISSPSSSLSMPSECTEVNS